jgi:methyl-accepting chemotaxis protein
MKLNLHNKIMGLAGLLMAALVGLGVLAWWGVGQLTRQADQAAQRLQESGRVLDTALGSLKQYQHFADLMITRDLKTVQSFAKGWTKFQGKLNALESLADTGQEKEWAKAANAAGRKFGEVFNQKVVPEINYLLEERVSRAAAEADGLIQVIQESCGKLADSFRGRLKISIMAGEYDKVVEQAAQVDDVGRLTNVALAQYRAMARLVLSQDMKQVEVYDNIQAQWDSSMETVRKSIQGDQEAELLRKAGQAYETFDTVFRESVIPGVNRSREKRLAGFNHEADQVLASLDGNLGKMITALGSEAGEATAEYRSTAAFTANLVAVAVVAAALIGLVFSFLLARSIARPIRVVVDGLGQSSRQVSSAAGEVSSSGQSLAQSASEQAASLEETASSLEELTATTSSNAERAVEADRLMRQASQSVERANASMKELTQAMAGISASSEQSGKIIQTIDEIAFQTNLLALNAAVEAARAGEAGAGFAVVADEVRNLAMRAAEAARNTGELIQDNLKEIKKGAELVETADNNFDQVQANAGQVAELVAQIATAGAEQAQGLGLINKAASEMDSLTQQVAASAEQAAATGEQLSAQALGLKEMVARLDKVVSGGGGGRKPGEKKAKLEKKPERKLLPENAPRENVPELDDPDFKDF